MALDPDTWLEQAQALDEGKRIRTTHTCGEGKVLYVDHKAKGWGAWCVRCNDSGWVFRPQESLTQRLARIKATRAVEDVVTANTQPPTPANRDPSSWPLEQRVWLYKAGIGNDKIKALGFYYHEPTKRVVLPVYDGSRCVYWQARGFDPDRPKYLNPGASKVVYRAAPADANYTKLPLVLTEDILSAVRVGEVCEAWCLMGTSIPDSVLAKIMALKRPVLVWLDPDAAGLKGARKFVPKLRAYGVDAKSIQLTRDPKFHSIEEITAVVRPDTAASA